LAKADFIAPSLYEKETRTKLKRGFKKMSEKNFAVVFRMPQDKWQQVEDFLDRIGAVVIFVKQADANRKLVVKNLPAWEEEKENGKFESENDSQRSSACSDSRNF
jgi:phage-related protein